MNDDEFAQRVHTERTLEEFFRRVRMIQMAALWAMFAVFGAPWLAPGLRLITGDESVSLWPPVLTTVIGALPLLMLSGTLWRLRQVCRWNYFHPKGLHFERYDCVEECRKGLSTLEHLAVAAATSPPEPPMLFWLVWDGKWTPYRMGGKA